MGSTFRKRSDDVRGSVCGNALMIAPDSVEASSESATTILYRGIPVEENERPEPMNLIERWKDDPAPILAQAIPNALCLMIATSLIFGLVWGMIRGASGEQALMTTVFGGSVFAVSLFPFILLANAMINDGIRVKRREAEQKAKTDRETQERVDRKRGIDGRRALRASQPPDLQRAVANRASRDQFFGGAIPRVHRRASESDIKKLNVEFKKIKFRINEVADAFFK
ncbi:MAG: hypothetical protein EOO77_29085, partial [Oxalobacteraceae bacterium]